MNFYGQNQYQPNWYEDPQNPNQLRYFDGTSWTQHISPKPYPQSNSSNGTMATFNKGMSIFRNVAAGIVFLFALVYMFASSSYILGLAFLVVGVVFTLLLLPINFKYKKHLDAGRDYADWFIESFKYWYTYVFVLIVIVGSIIAIGMVVLLSPNGEPDSSSFFVAFGFFFPGAIWTMEITAKIFDLPLGYGK